MTDHVDLRELGEFFEDDFEPVSALSVLDEGLETLVEETDLNAGDILELRALVLAELGDDRELDEEAQDLIGNLFETLRREPTRPAIGRLATQMVAKLDEADEFDRALAHERRNFKAKGKGMSDELRNYSDQAGRVPLLNRQQEGVLGRRVQAARKAQKQLDEGIEGLDPAEVRRLAVEVRRGERATEDIIAANLRLVISIARVYNGRGLEMEDLVQEGNFGLFRAVEKFDPEKGFKFSTYATWWIRQSMTRAIADTGNVIRIPVHAQEKLNALKKMQKSLESELKKTEVPKELLAQRLGWNLQAVEDILLIEKQILAPHSLDSSLNDDTESTLYSFIESGDVQADPQHQAELASLRTQIDKLLEPLDDRERRVMVMRHLEARDGMRQTLQEVGEALGVTRERARQIEAAAFRKIRAGYNAKLDEDTESEYGRFSPDQLLTEAQRRAQKRRSRQQQSAQ